MKKCKCCNENDAIKYSKYSNGDFCSRKCARAFSSKEKRSEINKAVSLKLLGRKVLNPHVFSEERLKEIKERRRKLYDDKILSANYDDLSFERLRIRVFLEQGEKCNKCKLSEWLGVKIPFELEHIDGNHHNNERSNVEALCPNCHSLTPTWRGRNKSTTKMGINDDDLFKALIENNFNMRQALISVGYAAKGNNYKRCHRLKREYDELINSQEYKE
jgi:hypothetical protein